MFYLLSLEKYSAFAYLNVQRLLNLRLTFFAKRRNPPQSTVEFLLQHFLFGSIEERLFIVYLHVICNRDVFGTTDALAAGVHQWFESAGIKHGKFGKYAMTRRAWQPLATGSDSGGQVQTERPVEKQMGQ